MRAVIVVAVSSVGLGCSGPALVGPPAPAPQPPVATSEEPPAIAVVESAPVQPGDLGSEAAAYRHLLGLHVAFYSPRHKDNKKYEPADGYLAPVARTSDNSFLFGGQAEVNGESKPVIGKMSGSGDMQWQVPMDKTGYRSYEGGLVNETPDGNYVGHIMSYKNPALNPTYCFAKVTPDGTPLWRLDLPTDKHGNSPQIHLARVTADSSLLLSGHLYEGPRGKKDRPAYGWSGRITADGKLIDIGKAPPIDWAKDEW